MSAGALAAEKEAVPEERPAQRSGKTSLVGQTLGKNYRVIEPIGAGGMGIVYLVEHVVLKKRFAAKVLNADLASNAEACARFEVEAHAVSVLDHDNIINVIDYGTSEDGLVFMVMEYLKGRTLQSRIDETPLTADELLGVMLQVCHALGCAHEAGIVHRDMKPDNIFLNERMRGRPPMVKVLDFGISKARDVSLRDGRITKQGQVLGSPEYMSPEAARGDEVDSRADIYAVGIILYEMVTGQVPFRSENYLKVLQQHISQKPVPPRQLVPELSEAMEKLMLRALAKHPDGRQQTMEELENELLAAMPDEAVRVLNPRRSPSGGSWLMTPPVGVPVASRATSEPPVTPPPNTPVPAAAAEPVLPPEPVSPTLDITAPTAARKRFLVRAGVAALLAILLGVVGFRQLGGGKKVEKPAPVPVPAVVPAAAATAPAPAPPEPAPPEVQPEVPAPVPPHPAGDRISFRVDSVPRGATVALNGKVVGRTPVSIQVGRGRKPGQLKLTLKDHSPVARKVDLSRAVDLNIPLEHLGPAEPAKPDAGHTDLELRQNR